MTFSISQNKTRPRMAETIALTPARGGRRVVGRHYGMTIKTATSLRRELWLLLLFFCRLTENVGLGCSFRQISRKSVDPQQVGEVGACQG